MPSRNAEPAAISRRELQRAASVARIVAAAEELMSETSRFSDISVEQVVSRAGASRSTFYSYFDDMGHLLRTVGEGVVGEVVSSARQWMDLDTGITQQRLQSIFEGLIDTYRRRAKLLAALAEASTYDEGVRDEFHAMLSIGHVELAKHIRRAQGNGSARADVDPEVTAAWLVWMIERGLYQQVRPAAKRDLARHAASLAAIVWHSLYAPAP
jgi:AcrR family transcriptional regulator